MILEYIRYMIRSMVLPACELDFLPAVLWQLLGAGSVRSAAAFALPPSGPPPGPPASRQRHGDAHGDAAREPQELPELQLTCMVDVRIATKKSISISIIQ